MHLIFPCCPWLHAVTEHTLIGCKYRDIGRDYGYGYIVMWYVLFLPGFKGFSTFEFHFLNSFPLTSVIKSLLTCIKLCFLKSVVIPTILFQY